MSAEIHIIGLDVQVGPIRRQRCSWCGALLQEDDYTRMAWQLNEDGSDPGPPGCWPVGELMEIDGPVRRVIPREEWPDSDKEPGEKRLPDECCAAPGLCTMCEQKPATTTWGFPVCDDCAKGLGELHADLQQMEADDPSLLAAGDQVRAAERDWLASTKSDGENIPRPDDTEQPNSGRGDQ